MDRQEALDRLKLIDALVQENRGSALEDGTSWMWLGGCMSLAMLAADGVAHAWLPGVARIPLGILVLLLLIGSFLVEWRRYRRYRATPTLAFKVYLAFMYGSFYVILPFLWLQAQGRVSADTVITLLYGLLALSFAVFRPILGHRWLDGFGLFWFVAACYYGFARALNPYLFSSACLVIGWVLPGYFLYRHARHANP